MVTALLVKLASRSHIGQNGHTILVKRATYSRIAIKRVNVLLFWSKPSHMRITTKTAIDFSLFAMANYKDYHHKRGFFMDINGYIYGRVIIS